MILLKRRKVETEKIKPRLTWAKSLAKKLLSQIGSVNPPILINDVVIHLKKTHDLSVYSWRVSDKIDGIQVTNGDSSAIGYNDKKHPHRQRFTVGHEIGHLLMKHTKGNYEIDLESKNPIEAEANHFAAELLVPAEMLKRDIATGNNNIKGLSRKYFVSEQVITLKVIEEKLLDKLT